MLAWTSLHKTYHIVRQDTLKSLLFNSQIPIRELRHPAACGQQQSGQETCKLEKTACILVLTKQDI